MGGPDPARRILITGVANFWGSGLARALLADPAVERVVGIDTRTPPPDVAGEALAEDGTSRAFGGADRPAADAALTAALAAAAGTEPAAVVTHDVFYDPVDRLDEWAARGAVAVEMEAATVFALCAARGIPAGCLLAVSDTLRNGFERVDHDGLVAIGERLGAVAVKALAS